MNIADLEEAVGIAADDAVAQRCARDLAFRVDWQAAQREPGGEQTRRQLRLEALRMHDPEQYAREVRRQRGDY